MTRPEYLSKYDGLRNKIRVTCHCCDETTVGIWVGPGENPRVVCHKCRSYDSRTSDINKQEEVYSTLRWLVKDSMADYGCGPVTIFRPGDDGFDERAAEIQPSKKQKRTYHYNTFGRG